MSGHITGLARSAGATSPVSANQEREGPPGDLSPPSPHLGMGPLLTSPQEKCQEEDISQFLAEELWD